MRNFKFHNPKTVAEALEILHIEQDCRILAGGTDLVIAIKEKKVDPKALVNISNIAELQGIYEVDDKIVIKSATTFTAVTKSELIKRRIPALADASSVVGSPQICNQGTLGGNIANASPAADSVPVMVLFEGKVTIASVRGTREVLITELLTGPGKHTLAADELITEITLEPLKNSVNGFHKLGRRNALAISRISGCLEVTFTEEKITAARVVLGSVGPNPFRAAPVEELLIGRQFSQELAEEFIAKTCSYVGERLGDRASAVYKREAIAGVMRSAWQKVTERRSGLLCKVKNFP